MLNLFTDFITKKMKLARDNILQSDVRNRRDYNQLIASVFDLDLDVQKMKFSFIRKETHPGNNKRARESMYKRLGDNYIDHLDIRYKTYGLATTVFVDVKNNAHQHRGQYDTKIIYVAKAIEIKTPEDFSKTKNGRIMS